MSSSNCCFLTWIQVSQEAGQVVWYSHLFQNFPQFIMIYTVKGFGIVSKPEIDVVFLELLLFQWSSGCWQFDLWFLCLLFIYLSFIFISWRLITLQYCSGFCHTLTWISHSSAFSKTSLNIWKFMVHVLLKPGLENFEHCFTSVWDECNCAVVWAFFGIAFLE